jgi:hypothetical protein
MGRTFLSPTGARIKGTVESLPACAPISDIDEHGIPVHSGDESELFWDAMQTQVDSSTDQVLYMDENGEEWTFKDLTVAPEDVQ